MATTSLKITAGPLSGSRPEDLGIGGTFHGISLDELQAVVDSAAVETLGFGSFEEVPACAVLGSIEQSEAPSGSLAGIRSLAEKTMAAFGSSATLVLEPA